MSYTYVAMKVETTEAHQFIQSFKAALGKERLCIVTKK